MHLLSNDHAMEIEYKMNLLIREEREQLFFELYEIAFPKVAKFVANRGGSFQDAKDIFHDALVVLYEKAIEGEENFPDTPERYLIGIAKHLWLRKFREDNKKLGLDDFEKQITIPEDYYETDNNRLASILELTGRKCLALLRAFYYEGWSLGQVKKAFGFSTLHSASAQKFKCVEKLRDTVQQKSLRYEDLA
jgi:DNA-directed RNA polymerase specialized sigma24 family protein